MGGGFVSKRGRQYTLSFNSMHRITRGAPPGRFPTRRPLSASPGVRLFHPASQSAQSRAGGGGAAGGGGGEHRSASPFKGDGERGRCAAGALFSSSLTFMLNRLQVLAEWCECVSGRNLKISQHIYVTASQQCESGMTTDFFSLLL